MAVFNSYNPMLRQNYEQNLKNIIEQASGQLQQLQQMQNQPQMPTNLTQNFQITPQSNNPSELQSAYVNNIDEVKNIFMTRNGIFIDKDLTTLWFKNIEGNIRTFNLAEVIERDEKDIQIEDLIKENEEKKYEIHSLKKQIEEIKYLMQKSNEKVSEDYIEEVKSEKKTSKK